MKSIYSTAEVAGLLSVNDSTIKRWSDTGSLQCIRTKGKHRRFSLASVMKFVQENNIQMPELASRIFKSPELHAQLIVGNNDPMVKEIQTAALEGDLDRCLTAFRISLTSQPDLLAFFSKTVFPPLVRIGKDWEEGRISIDQEHLASGTLREALVLVQSDLHYKEPNGLTALCACYEGELHEIVLYCVSTYLTVQGWMVYHLGSDMPSRDLADAIRRREPDLAILSAAMIPDKWKFQNDISTVIEPAVRRAGGRLCIGGPQLRERFARKLKADFIIESIGEMAAVSDSINFVRE